MYSPETVRARLEEAKWERENSMSFEIIARNMMRDGVQILPLLLAIPECPNLWYASQCLYKSYGSLDVCEWLIC
jgi:hypothetical protein